jgi:LysM repeat protein
MNRRRARRSPARFLGPLALIAVVVAFLAIVSGSGTNSGSSPTDTSTNTTPTASHKTGAKKKSTVKSTTQTTAQGPKTYTVVVGDTLGAIATKTGVSLDQIQTLNPDVDPHAMVAGQVIKLR